MTFWIALEGYVVKCKSDIGLVKFFLWIFNKKPCLKCSGKLKRKRTVEVTEPKITSKGFRKIIDHMKNPHEIREYTHGFICKDCGKYFTFSEVRHQKNG